MAGKIKSPSKLKYPEFNWSDSLIVSVQKRSIGHAKLSAMLARIIMRQMDRAVSMHFLHHLSNLGFYGEDIWYGFTEYCRSDEDMFEAVIEIEDKDYANFVLDWKAQQALKALKGK